MRQIAVHYLLDPEIMRPPAQPTAKWLYVRLLVVGFFTVGGPGFAAGAPQDIPFWIPILVFVAAFGIMLRQFHQGLRRLPTRDWSRPTWFTNPFSGPPHFMHMGSFAFMGAGIAAAIPAISHHRALVIPLFPFAGGLDIYCALRVFYHFRGDSTPRV